MIITESKLRRIIRKEILNESTKTKVLTTLLLALSPLLMSGTKDDAQQMRSNQINYQLSKRVEALCNEEGVDITNPEHSDRLQQIILRVMRGSLSSTLKKYEDPEDIDPSASFRR